jgi:hypothetical protein
MNDIYLPNEMLPIVVENKLSLVLDYNSCLFLTAALKLYSI